MRISDSLFPAFLFAAAVSGLSNHDNISGLRLRRRTEGGHGSFPGVRPGSPDVPQMFRRDVGCPTYAPNTCDVFWCSQVCCGDGNGNYCLYGEYCVAGTEWCCIEGLPCAISPSSTTRTTPTSPPTTTRTSSTLLLSIPSLTTRPVSSTRSSSRSATSQRSSTTSRTSSPSATSTGTRSRDQLKAIVLDALAEIDDVTRFAKAVKDQEDLFDLLDPSLDYTILAPSDSAGVPDGDGFESAGIKAQLALAFVQRESPSSLSSRPMTLKTSLQDATWVDLGSGESARLVSTPTSQTNISIIAGMGRSVSFGESTAFVAGTIHVGTEYFTLPESLSVTLRGTNGSAFENLLRVNGQFDTLSEAQGVTIFALTDSAVASLGNRLTKTTLDQGIIRDFLGYTPDLFEGQVYTTVAGSKIAITIRNGVYFVNGVRIVVPNIITTNGVVHYVTEVIPANPSVSGGSPGKSPIGPIITLLAVIAALTPYYLIS